MKFRKRPRYLFGDYEDKSLKNQLLIPFNETENNNSQRHYGAFGHHNKTEDFDALTKVKQNQASKNIIK